MRSWGASGAWGCACFFAVSCIDSQPWTFKRWFPSHIPTTHLLLTGVQRAVLLPSSVQRQPRASGALPLCAETNSARWSQTLIWIYGAYVGGGQEPLILLASAMHRPRRRTPSVLWDSIWVDRGGGASNKAAAFYWCGSCRGQSSATSYASRVPSSHHPHGGATNKCSNDALR